MADRYPTGTRTLAALLLIGATVAHAQSATDQDATGPARPADSAGGRPPATRPGDAPSTPPVLAPVVFGSGAPWGGGVGGSRMGMRSLFTPRNNLDPFTAVLADLNLSTSFNLTAEQKQKVAAVREAFARVNESWREANAADLSDLQAELRELGTFGGLGGPGPGTTGTENPDPDGEKRRALVETIRQVIATAPTGDVEVNRIRKLLTRPQVEQLDARLIQIQSDVERRRFGDWTDGSPGGSVPVEPTRHRDPRAE